MKITLVLLFAVATLASAETALPVNAWKMADECVEAVNAPFYIPSVHSLRTIGVNEEVRSHKTGGCFKMDLPGRTIGWVRIEAGRSFIFRKADGKVLRLAECGNKIYEEAHFAKTVAVMQSPVAPVVTVQASAPPAASVSTSVSNPVSGLAPANIPILTQASTGGSQSESAPAQVLPAPSVCSQLEVEKLVAQLQKKGRKKNFEISCGGQTMTWQEHKPAKTVIVNNNGESGGVGYVPGSYGYASGYGYIQGGFVETSRGESGINGVWSSGGVGWHR
jgi:hypothetical protein